MSDTIGEDREFHLKTFVGLELAETRLDARVFEECSFTRCSFNAAVFDHCKFIECSFQGCDLSNLKPLASRFQAVAFEECKLIGIDWTRADWPRFATPAALAFRKSNLSYCSFQGLELHELVLQECRVHQADFREGDFSRSDFSWSDFADSAFGSTRLGQVDFSEACNYLIDIRDNQLRGARFTRTEVAGLLHGQGIELVD